jgi:hypothetical protein
VFEHDGESSVPTRKSFTLPELRRAQGSIRLSRSRILGLTRTVAHLGVTLVVVLASTPVLAGVAVTPNPSRSVVLARGFDEPSSMALDGVDLFVSNAGSAGYGGRTERSFLTEVNAVTGAQVRVISGPEYRFDDPSELLVAGQDLFILSVGGFGVSGTITEVKASTGALVRVLAMSADGFSEPVAMALSGDNLFVADPAGATGEGSVMEVDTSTGSLVRVISGRQYDFYGPLQMAVVGHDLFVAETPGLGGASCISGCITELDTETGVLVRVISGATYKLGTPRGVAVNGSDLFLTEERDRSGLAGPSSVTEVNATTGALVRVISGPAYQFDGAAELALHGNHLFVADLGLAPGRGGITEINASSGVLLRVLSGTNVAYPTAMVVDGSELLVTNGVFGSVVEVTARFAG